MPTPTLFLYKETQANNYIKMEEWIPESTSIYLGIQNLKTHKTAIMFFRQGEKKKEKKKVVLNWEFQTLFTNLRNKSFKQKLKLFQILYF